MSRKNSILGLYEHKNPEFLGSFKLMTIKNFMLNWVEHEKNFYNLGAWFKEGMFLNVAILLSRSFERSMANIRSRLFKASLA